MTGSRYFADDWPMCPGCDRQLGKNDWCDRCETHSSDWSTVTLAEWNARNPEVVREIQAAMLVPMTEVRGDPFLKRRAA